MSHLKKQEEQSNPKISRGNAIIIREEINDTESMKINRQKSMK